MSDLPKKRIVLIGPILPFRGGIAQHTTMLHRALRKQADVLTISFSRQYPSWLFPGESDLDPAYQGHNEAGVDYCIDSINPLTWSKAVTAIGAFEPQAVIIPWWTVYWAICFRSIAQSLKRSGIPVIYFCHNVIDHESAPWKRALTKWVLGTTYRFTVHSRNDRETLSQLIPDAEVLIHPHPIYDQFPNAIGTLSKRADLELLFFGFVRPYKGLDLLIDALARLQGRSIMLTIAGEFWSGVEDTMKHIDAKGISHMIEVRPRYHTEEDTAELFTRADVVVLPYRSATGSGIIPLSYHYHTPVIATRVGGLPDVVIDSKTGWIIEPKSTEQLAQTITSISREQASTMKEDIAEFAKCLTWDSMADALLASVGKTQRQ